MIKERVLLKGRKVSAYFDLTPNAKMNIIGCTVAFSQRGPDGEPLDIEVVLPLSWVAGKDGRVIAQRLRQILSEAGIDPDDVIIAVTDGGGDNHGGGKLTGHGKNGTVAEAVANDGSGTTLTLLALPHHPPRSSISLAIVLSGVQGTWHSCATKMPCRRCLQVCSQASRRWCDTVGVETPGRSCWHTCQFLQGRRMLGSGILCITLILLMR